MKFKSVSILGCGWLGLPLAQQLVRRGYLVRGSTTQQGKIPALQKSSIEPYLIECSAQLNGEQVENFLKSQVLIITIPFKRDLPDPSYYKHQIDSIIRCLNNSGVQLVIFTGSTAVYPQAIDVAEENQEIEPDNPRSAVLLAIEKILLSQPHFTSTVIRFAGLYGPGRPIGKFLAGKIQLPNPHQPVNLIHLDDCVAILERVLERGVGGQILNACADSHPLRQKIYTRAAANMGLPPPTFVEAPTSFQRIVANTKLKKILEYEFTHPNPLEDIGKG